METVYFVGIINIIWVFVMYFFLARQTDRMEEKIDKLLRTQTEPKKPKNLRMIGRDEIGGNCPSCGRVVSFAQRYCHNCTQLLDWVDAVTWQIENDKEDKNGTAITD